MRPADRGKRYPKSALSRRRGSFIKGFTTTVRANQAVTVAAAKFDGNVFQTTLTAELHGDVTGN